MMFNGMIHGYAYDYDSDQEPCDNHTIISKHKWKTKKPNEPNLKEKKTKQNHWENPKNQTSGRNPRHKHKPLYARAFGFLVLVQLSRGKRRMRKMIKRRRSEGRGSGEERQGNEEEWGEEEERGKVRGIVGDRAGERNEDDERRIVFFVCARLPRSLPSPLSSSQSPSSSSPPSSQPPSLPSSSPSSSSS